MKKRSLKNYTKSYNVRLNQLPPRYADEAFQGFSKYIETEPRLTLEALWVLPLRNFFPLPPAEGKIIPYRPNRLEDVSRYAVKLAKPLRDFVP